MRIEGVDYEVLIATDVEQDSMQWECYLANGTDRQLLLEVVRLDGSKEWVFIQHAPALPLALVEYTVAHAKKELGPFFEG